MKTKTTRIIILGALAGTLALGGVAIAHPGSGGRGDFSPGIKLMRLFHDLDLSEEQEVQMVRARRDLRKQQRALREQVRTDKKTAMTELAKDSPNPQILHNLVDQRFEQMRAMAHKAIDKVMELHKTLTPKQRTVLVERTQHMQDRMDKRRERRDRRSR